MFTIRRATQDDKAHIWHVHRDAIRQTCRSHYSSEVIRLWADGLRPEKYEEAIRLNHFFVAEQDGVVVGFAELDHVAEEVTGLYVSPDVAARGVGKKLLSTLEEIARDHGFKTLHLTASLNAVKFYEHAGFSAIDTMTKTLCPGVERASVRMVKDLPRE